MPYEGRDRSAGAESADPVDARVTIEESPFGVEAGGEAGAIPFIESDDGGAIVEWFDERIVKGPGGKEILNGAFGEILVAEIQLFHGGELELHFMFQEYGYVATFVGTGQDDIGDPVLINILDPQFNRIGGVGMEVEILADVAKHQVGFAVAIDIRGGDRLPPTIEFVEVGRYLFEMVGFPAEDAGGHPFARDDELAVFAAGDICSRYKFTHAADAMARIVIANALFFARRKVTDLVIPWCTYTDPEVAHVGFHEKDIFEKDITDALAQTDGSKI